MELITFIKNPYNVVVIPKENQKYFKQKEQEVLNNAMELVKLL